MNTTVANEVQDVKKFYTDFYGADNSISAFVGELDKKQVTFATWPVFLYLATLPLFATLSNMKGTDNICRIACDLRDRMHETSCKLCNDAGFLDALFLYP